MIASVSSIARDSRTGRPASSLPTQSANAGLVRSANPPPRGSTWMPLSARRAVSASSASLIKRLSRSPVRRLRSPTDSGRSDANSRLSMTASSCSNGTTPARPSSPSSPSSPRRASRSSSAARAASALPSPRSAIAALRSMTSASGESASGESTTGELATESSGSAGAPSLSSLSLVTAVLAALRHVGHCCRVGGRSVHRYHTLPWLVERRSDLQRVGPRAAGHVGHHLFLHHLAGLTRGADAGRDLLGRDLVERQLLGGAAGQLLDPHLVGG